MKNYLELIRNGNNVIDITGKKKIIWGAGKNTRRYCANLQLKDIAFIVDSNALLVGRSISLYGKEYIIQSPAVLKEISNEEYVIMIAAVNYSKEIRTRIADEYNNAFNVCEKESEFVRGFYSIDQLFLYDPFICRKIAEGNLSLYRDELVYEITTVVNEVLGEDKFRIFYSVQDGIRITFIIRNGNGEEFFMSIPTRKHREENSPFDNIQIKEAYYAKMKVLDDNDLVVYMNPTGIEITRGGDIDIDWDDVNIHKIIDQIRDINNSGIIVEAKRFPLSRIIDKEHFICDSQIDFLETLKNLFHECCDEEITTFIPVLCNGDLHAGNIVCYNDRLNIIDWEWIGMSDPMWDVICFIISIKGLAIDNKTIRKYIEYYLGRKLEEKENIHFLKLWIAVEYYMYLCFVAKYQKRDEKQESQISRHIEDLNSGRIS